MKRFRRAVPLLKPTSIMFEIIPAIIPLSFSDLEEKLSLIKGLVSTVHVDVSDGRFTPNVTFPFHLEDKEHLERIKKEEEGMPFWQNFDFEVHCMTETPERYVEDWIRAGAARIIAHVETITDFSLLKKEVGELTELGLAVLYDTPLEKIDPYREDIQSVQLMSIAKIGYQGQNFEEGIYERITMLRQKYPELTISVDGGVNLENTPKLIKAGANRLVVGSAIFESENIAETIEDFKKFLNYNF